ncbi:ABC-type polar amino acid transport system [Commensalibacter communis]|uniref:ATPase component (GlnQ) n=1 Tax=Commensalibacter communis TaxID=2972786 RepID=A0A9W4TKJ8_9PROT|nr:ABC transporter ATP-binding protein [Commensalibacter communis]CAI3923420.1 ABC-type polar amino acid transport system [Commensalibacter communis]CAI3923425.1 ABC-type polar amino acid transport system [Commensalibacter communis]CAI3929925.1 ABC-type polar amino acid transport system [Commensalibacter communis]CAI3930999.1 ABC-type polar amino acid transport system [Commensalibacter communis]CAI3931268.1 ABC-type polar amino acid transport system [Commensalibacter communis]
MANKILLDIHQAKPSFDENYLPPVAFDLKVKAGECVIIECRDLEVATAFADLCSGMVALRDGKVLFKGLDWFDLKEPRLSALRGCIGRVFQKNGWMDMYSVAVNILLPSLHHTRIDEDKLVDQAMTLCRKFGLPGLPMDTAREATMIDLFRASCVRALLNNPDLLLLEYPAESSSAELMSPLLEMLNIAQNRGAGIICFTRQFSLWNDYKDRVTHWMRLQEKGLTSIRLG